MHCGGPAVNIPEHICQMPPCTAHIIEFAQIACMLTEPGHHSIAFGTHDQNVGVPIAILDITVVCICTFSTLERIWPGVHRLNLISVYILISEKDQDVRKTPGFFLSSKTY